MEHTVKWMRPSPPGVQQVWRAKFSAISGPEIRAAMVRPLAQCMQLAVFMVRKKNPNACPNWKCAWHHQHRCAQSPKVTNLCFVTTLP